MNKCHCFFLSILYLMVKKKRRNKSNRERSTLSNWAFEFYEKCLFSLFSFYSIYGLDIVRCAIYMCWTCIWCTTRWTKCRHRTNCNRSTRIEHRTWWIISAQVRNECECINDLMLTNWNSHTKLIHSYETANGIQAEESGTLKKATSADTNDAIIAQGNERGKKDTAPLAGLLYVSNWNLEKMT